MGPETFYQPDSNDDIHQGAIYHYRPFFWLDPPLWLLRDETYPRSGRPGTAHIWGITDLPDPFGRRERKQEEYVIATAKERPLVILSRNHYLRHERNDNILVAPISSFKPEHYQDHPSFVDRVKDGKVPGVVYIPQYKDGEQIILKEGKIDLKQAKTVKRRFLTANKLNICLTDEALGILVYDFLRLLPTDLLPFE